MTERVNRILSHPVYQDCMKRLAVKEETRVYCRHGLEHQLDVARIAWIICLEEGFSIRKDVVYAAALLHDLGRAEDYEDHDRAGAVLAERILPDCGYCPEEVLFMAEAVRRHGEETGETELGDLLHRADRLSRNCFGCTARDTCKWSEEEKNKGVMA